MLGLASAPSILIEGRGGPGDKNEFVWFAHGQSRRC
jgi:hypothetical protein